MTVLNEIRILMRKELITEFRQKYAISGILLYVLSSVILVFYSYGQQIGGTMPNGRPAGGDVSVWVSFIWLICLFASVNAVAKSFVQENSHRQLYYYSLVSPVAVILSKIIYNCLLLFILSLIAYFTLTVVIGNPVQESSLFLLILFLGASGLSITLTFISAIASKSSSTGTLLAILGFPVILPILLTLIRLSRYAVHLNLDRSYTADLGLLIAFDGILVAMSLLLFPFLWRD